MFTFIAGVIVGHFLPQIYAYVRDLVTAQFPPSDSSVQ